MYLPSLPRCRNGVNSPYLPACVFLTTGRPPMYCPHIVAFADLFELHTAEAFSDPSVKEKGLTLDDTLFSYEATNHVTVGCS